MLAYNYYFLQFSKRKIFFRKKLKLLKNKGDRSQINVGFLFKANLSIYLNNKKSHQKNQG
jgi:hypothetical protein